METRNGCVLIDGFDAQMVARLGAPMGRALGGRGTSYSVRIDGVGRVGETLVSITGVKGHLPLIFAHGDLDPGYVCSVVQRSVNHFGL